MPTRFVRVRIPETGTHVTLTAQAAAAHNLPKVHGPALDRAGRPRPPKFSLNHQPPTPSGGGDTPEATPSPTTTEE